MRTALFSRSRPRRHIRSPWLRLLYALPLVYAGMFITSRLVIGWLFPAHTHTQVAYEGEAAIIFTLAFFVFFTPLLYLFSCLLARQMIRLQGDRLLLYMGATFMGGALGEILIGNLGEAWLGRMIWYYQIWPQHGGYTTGVGAVMWPMYGFYLYCFNEALRLRGSSVVNQVMFSGVMIAIDAMVLETLANIFSLATFNTYYFFYVTGDLLHFSSIEIFLPYVLFGILGSALLKLLDKPHYARAWLGLALYLVGIWQVFIL